MSRQTTTTYFSPHLPDEAYLVRVAALYEPLDHDDILKRHRCFICGCVGFSSITRLGGRTVFWCRRGHPQHLIGEE